MLKSLWTHGPSIAHQTTNFSASQPPPAFSRPEASNLPHKHYEMSSDLNQFVPPQWYNMPGEPARPAPIFPWEHHQPRPSRVFPQDHRPEPLVVEASTAVQSQPDSPTTDVSTVGSRKEPQTPPTPTSNAASSEPWSAFNRGNAWDEVPEIHRYVDAIQKHRRTKSQTKTDPQPALGEQSLETGGSRVTDFPSEVDRPSLPVTPAPIRRPNLWGGGGPGPNPEAGKDAGLPAAEGVPPQSAWVCATPLDSRKLPLRLTNICAITRIQLFSSRS